MSETILFVKLVCLCCRPCWIGAVVDLKAAAEVEDVRILGRVGHFNERISAGNLHLEMTKLHQDLTDAGVTREEAVSQIMPVT